MDILMLAHRSQTAVVSASTLPTLPISKRAQRPLLMPVHDLRVIHGHAKSRSIVYSAETQRVMIVDFERSEMLPLPENGQLKASRKITGVCGAKRKSAFEEPAWVCYWKHQCPLKSPLGCPTGKANDLKADPIQAAADCINPSTRHRLGVRAANARAAPTTAVTLATSTVNVQSTAAANANIDAYCSPTINDHGDLDAKHSEQMLGQARNSALQKAFQRGLNEAAWILERLVRRYKGAPPKT
ncbi:MAG: hypothetical protein M1819_000464 [Sarea resinae]|nr:MAG: hypothetical protein M1819_000464 [Sarea resinae]